MSVFAAFSNGENCTGACDGLAFDEHWQRVGGNAVVCRLCGDQGECEEGAMSDDVVRCEILSDDGISAHVRITMPDGKPPVERIIKTKIARELIRDIDGKPESAVREAVKKVRDALMWDRINRVPLADQVNLALSQPKLPPGMRWVSDAYGLRQQIRKAKHFRIDAAASAYVAQASMTIAEHLEESRELARAPYPLLWVQVDNPARLQAFKRMGVGLTRSASGQVDGEATPFVGWLIERHPTQHSAHRAHYFTSVLEGVIVAPMAFTWDCDGRDCPWDMGRAINPLVLGAPIVDFMLGLKGAKCSAVWATGGWVNTYAGGDLETKLMWEFAGELRHIFAFLVTIGHVPTEEREIIRQDVDVSQPPPVVKGKPVYPLVHRDIVIRLPKHRDLAKVITRVCEGMRKRRHEVRGHWRYYYNEDGSVRRRVWVREHERGDESLGRVVRSVEKSLGYRVST